MSIPALIALVVAIVTISAGAFTPLFGNPFQKKSDLRTKKAELSVVPDSQIKPGSTPTPIPTPQPTPIKSGPTSIPTLTPTPSPAQVLAVSSPVLNFSLLNWKLTLPVGSSKSPTEIRQPALDTYQIDPWFIVTAENAIRFRAPVNGVTTGGSKYPRSELREMTDGGTANAGWSSTKGTHTLFLDEAITHLPKTKPHIVAGQIHDSSDDIMVIRLESSNLYVNVNGKNVYKLDSNYTLGKRFTIKFTINGGKSAVYYNDSASPVYTLNKNYSGAYFKAGAYTQSNCSKEGSNLCKADNYGEVMIYRLKLD